MRFWTMLAKSWDSLFVRLHGHKNIQSPVLYELLQNMKKLALMGRSEAGKTTLTQALKGEKIHYHKTQYVNNFDAIIDTPGNMPRQKVWDMLWHCIHMKRILLVFCVRQSSRIACSRRAAPVWRTER